MKCLQDVSPLRPPEDPAAAERTTCVMTEVDAAGELLYASPAARRLFPDLERSCQDHPWIAGWDSVVAESRGSPSSARVRTVKVGDRYYHQTIHHHRDLGTYEIVGVDVTERGSKTDPFGMRMCLLEFAATHSLDELLVKTLDEVCAITDSPIGFYHFVAPDQRTLSLQSWSSRTTAVFCTATPDARHYSSDQAGVWADCLREGRAVIHNDYPSLPHKKGLPPGHAAVTREMVVPIRRGDLVVAILGVGNKPSDYTDRDVQIVSYLADVAWEIVERKRADEELRRREAELREADRQRSQFLAVLSHELRNPLAPIRNSLHILDRAAPGGALARKAKETIERQTGQLARLVDDLLDVTRLTRGKFRIEKARIDVVDVVRRTAEDHRALFDEAAVTFDVVIDADGPLWLDGDDARLTQALGNLLTNAAKFTPPRGKVTLNLSHEPPTALIRVQDTGVGIVEELLPRIFEPFVQADASLDRSMGGLGLGLALVRGVVEMHGGTIEAQSAGFGSGAEFIIRLPVEIQAALPLDEKRLSERTPRRRVLVIDDNSDAADSLRDLLEFGGHGVLVAYDGHDGIEKARAFEPDVILCDIGLPGMDGYAVAKVLRADENLRGARLVALSGYAQPEDRELATEAGFDAHIAKPPSYEAIEAVLRSVCSVVAN